MGKKTANKMEIKNIEYSFTHVLALETFSELRQTCWEYKAFRGGHVDNQSFGRIPNVWDIIPSIVRIYPIIFKKLFFCCKFFFANFLIEIF